MWPNGPQARFRLYTRWKNYFTFLKETILGRLSQGNSLAELEHELARFFGTQHAICAPMARMGIYLSIRNLIRPGQEVVMSPYTIADVVNVVIAAGGRPVFADIQIETCNIDPKEVERCIGPNTGAVLVTHLHGIPAEIETLRSICEAKKIPLVEDVAQAFGASVNKKRLGTFGTAGVFSFGMYKNINSWYGGLVITNDSELATRIRTEVRAYPFQTASFLGKKIKKGLLTDGVTTPWIFRWLTFWIFRFGFLHDVEWINKKVRTELDVSRRDSLLPFYLRQMTPFQARLVSSQLPQIDPQNRERGLKGKRYFDGLKNLPGLVVPPYDPNAIYTYFPIQAPQRNLFLKALMKEGCDVAAQHLKNCADLPGFNEFKNGHQCPRARQVADQVVILPTYPSYDDSEIDRNIQVIRRFFENLSNEKASIQKA